MTELKTDIAIVGAGLAGLALARALVADGREVLLLEARDRVGGRILSLPQDPLISARFDLGPAWIWPHNLRMIRLVEQLGLSVIPQHAQGSLVFQDQHGAVRRDLDFATMGDALRVPGGLAKIPEAIGSALPRHVLRLRHSVTELEASGDEIALSGTSATGNFRVTAQKVVLALPPRLAATFKFSPKPDLTAMRMLTSVPTWMAGQAKFIAIYDRPFWREMGLSGDAISHQGPLAEVHDASAEIEPGRDHALFGFLHPTATDHTNDSETFTTMALAQLAALFGEDARKAKDTRIKNWADDGFTSTPADRRHMTAHPVYGPVGFSASAWRDTLYFAGSETSRENGGFLEGALESAERTLAEIKFG